jgi:hypothetical protein
MRSRVADPHYINADPNPDPAFHLPYMWIQIVILPINFFPDLDPPMLQNDPLRLPPLLFEADPYPASQNDADLCGSGSATLERRVAEY